MKNTVRFLMFLIVNILKQQWTLIETKLCSNSLYNPLYI